MDDDDDEPTSYQELGALARWQVSSHKFGFSVLNLRDNNDDTFWQSEGPQPHAIDLAFPKRVLISAVHICLSHPQDDSYTPSKISVSAGTSMHDLFEVRMIEVDKPDGWGIYPLRPMNNSEDEEIGGPPIPAFYLRILVIQNHLNGKDTHVRGIRVYGSPGSTVSSAQLANARPSEMDTPQPLSVTPLPAVIKNQYGQPGTSDDVDGDAANVDPMPDEGWEMLMSGNDGLSGYTSKEFQWIAQGLR